MAAPLSEQLWRIEGKGTQSFWADAVADLIDNVVLVKVDEPLYRETDHLLSGMDIMEWRRLSKLMLRRAS